MNSNRWFFLILAAIALGSGGALLHSGALASEKTPDQGVLLAQGGDPVTPDPGGANDDENQNSSNKSPGDDDDGGLDPGGDDDEGNMADADVKLPKGVKDVKAWAQRLKKEQEVLNNARAQLSIDQQKFKADQDGLAAKSKKLQADKKAADRLKSLGVKGALSPPGEKGLSADEKARLDKVAKIVKKMKPKAAALMMISKEWKPALARKVFFRLKARISAPILSAMPPDKAGEITRGMAIGSKSNADNTNESDDQDDTGAFDNPAGTGPDAIKDPTDPLPAAPTIIPTPGGVST
jgi:flagellar motility protein MotE (MotC chaperone)